jgi:ATP-binding cassette, subfamily B, bacterial PglK
VSKSIQGGKFEGLRLVLNFAGRRLSVKLLLVIFASSVLDLLGIAVIFPYLGLVTDPQALANVTARLPQFAKELSAGTLLLLMSVLLLLAYFVKSACQVLLMRYQSRQLASLTTRLTDDTVEHMLNVRYGLFLALAGTEIGATVYASPIHFTLAYRAMLQIASELTFMMALFVAFLVVKPLPTLVAFGALGTVGIFLYLLVIRNTAKLGKRQSEAENTRYRLIFSMINAFREIKIMGLARLFESFNREVSHELEGVAWRYNFNHALPLSIIEAVVMMSVVGAVMGVVISGVNITEILPALGLVAVAAVRLVPAIARLFMALNSLRFYNESVKRLHTMRADLIKGRQIRTADELDFNKTIELNQVCFSHGDKLILKDISFQIESGKSYGIVGPSGSGKSTLLDLLSGLQPAETGQFLCDGKPFDPYTSGSLAKLIGYVPQDITVVDESLAFNIAFDHQPDFPRLEAVIRMANLHSLVETLPAGVHESLGEKGSRISGGQRQRVALARALYRQPKILILDEATSALDPISEREIANELAALKGRITMLSVSHKIAAVQDCDEIYVLDHGRVVGSGRHMTLLEQCPLYKDMYLAQQRSSLPVCASESLSVISV